MYKSTLLAIVLFAVQIFPQIKITAVGDVIPGSRTPKEVLPPDSGKVFNKLLGDRLQGSGIVFGNFEGTFIKDDMAPCKCSDSLRALGMCYEFGVPAYLLTPLKKLGFSVLNMENNHSRDYGAAGFNFTASLLRHNGIQPVIAGKPAVVVRGRDTICIIGFSQTSSSQNVNNIAKAKNLVKELAGKYAHVIVSFHGGAEGEDAKHLPVGGEKFLEEDRGDLRAFAHAVIDAGAQVVLGHGPHVLRAMELYKNHLIAYSLGNFLTYGNFSLKGSAHISCILNVSISDSTGEFLSGNIIPVVQEGRGLPREDTKKRSITLLNQLMHDDMHPNLLLIDEDGAIKRR
jgi:hypothetical protein